MNKVEVLTVIPTPPYVPKKQAFLFVDKEKEMDHNL